MTMLSQFIMKNLLFTAEVTFTEIGTIRANFPIIGKRRMSFYLKSDMITTPSEIDSGSVPITKAFETYNVKIAIMNRDFLEGRIKAGQNFFLGSLSEILGEGTIISVDEPKPASGAQIE